MSVKTSETENILFYDGDCGFCNQAVRICVKLDSNKKLYFASLGSTKAKRLRIKENNSVVLLINQKLLYKSDAILTALATTKFYFYPLLALKLIPRFMRDLVYDFIAKHRYKLTSSNYCFAPDEETKKRFL